MKNKYLSLLLCTGVLMGCELLPEGIKGQAKQNVKLQVCVWLEPNISAESSNCDLQSWIGFWAEIDSQTWPERKAQIEQLNSDSKVDVFKKVLLSQAKGTPYQNRLRAQLWLESLMPAFTPSMASFVRNSILHPSQELLEMESALVTLTKLNSNKQSVLDAQQAQLDKQKRQIEQLLNIETSIIDNNQEIPQ